MLSCANLSVCVLKRDLHDQSAPVRLLACVSSLLKSFILIASNSAWYFCLIPSGPTTCEVIIQVETG